MPSLGSLSRIALHRRWQEAFPASVQVLLAALQDCLKGSRRDVSRMARSTIAGSRPRHTWIEEKWEDNEVGGIVGYGTAWRAVPIASASREIRRRAWRCAIRRSGAQAQLTEDRPGSWDGVPVERLEGGMLRSHVQDRSSGCLARARVHGEVWNFAGARVPCAALLHGQGWRGDGRR